MVLLEMAMGKGLVSAGMGIVKSASTSGGVAASFVMAHPWDPVAQLGLHPPVASAVSVGTTGSHVWHDMVTLGSSLLGTMTTAAEATLRAGGEVAPAVLPACALGLLTHLGVFRDPEGSGEEEEKDCEQHSGVVVASISLLTAYSLWDSYMAGLFLRSFNTLALAAPLRTWLLGSVALSLPTTCLVDSVVRRKGARVGFLLEVGAAAASFVWLSWGTLLLGGGAAVHADPLLFWSCAAQCAMAWSCFSAMVCLLICTTVATILLGGRWGGQEA